MKMSKKILPALAMLIVSAVMLSTASFAWFALSEQVEANGMSVSIKSDSLYLLIAAVNKETAGGEDKVTTATLTAAQLQGVGENAQKLGSTSAEGYAIGTTEIYPAAYYQGNVKREDGKVVNSGVDFADHTYWYTATAASPDNFAMDADGAETLTGFNGYVVRYRYYVTLDVGSNDMDILRVKSLKISDHSDADGATLDPVKVVVACGAQKEEFSVSKDAGEVDLTGGEDLTSRGALEIILYVYYDGNDPTVTTNNVAAISSADIIFTLVAENASADT